VQKSENQRPLQATIGDGICFIGMGTDLYRLLLHGKMIGYRKQVGSYAFFSRDDFWYNGTELNYDHQQPYTGVKDRRGQKLFVGDVIRVEMNGVEKTLLIRSMVDNVPQLSCNITSVEVPTEDPLLTISRSHLILVGR
jgi:hypothetical protein